MKPVRFLFCAFAFFGLTQTVFSAPREETVTYQVGGQNVVATLALPEGKPAPVVVLFHGFTGSRNELPVATTNEGVFSRTARLLAEKGYASLRIDFRHSGQSGADYENTTFEGQVADGIAALNMLKADARVQGSKIGIIGWSQGGLVSTAVAGRTNVPAATVIWNGVIDPKMTFGGLLGADTLAKGLAAGDQAITAKLPWGAEVKLKRGFFEGVANFNPAKELAAYKGPLMATQGTKDTTVGPDSAQRFLAAHGKNGELWNADMDHVFNVFSGPQTLDAMVGATIAFLDKHLK